MIGGFFAPRARPTKQPVPAVGEHAHPHAVVPRGLVQVVVQLPDVLGVGVAARRRADAPLHLDERVQRRQVHRPARPFGGRILLDDLLARGQSGRDEEVPHRAGDVGLRLEVVVPPQHLPRGLSILRVVDVNLRSHNLCPRSAHPGRIASEWQFGYQGDLSSLPRRNVTP